MDPFIGEIRMFGGTFAPEYWAFCNGQLLSIEENSALFSLIGTTYGGDGQTTFALPDLRGRAPVHQNNDNPLGAKAGVEQVTLVVGQMPAHSHPYAISRQPVSASPAGQMVASSSPDAFVATTPNAPLAPQSISAVGGSKPHNNMQPYLCVNFIIALQGVYPPRN